MCQEHKIEALIKKYGAIRIEFEELKMDCPKYLSGNDNYIGIIGEYWAIKFLEQKDKKKLNSFLDDRKDNKVSKSQEWWDINFGGELISVKTITTENKHRISGHVKYIDLSEKLSVIIIMLDEKLQIKELLYLEDIKKIFKEEKIGKYKKRYIWENGKKLSFRFYENGFDPIFEKKYQYLNNSFIKKSDEVEAFLAILKDNEKFEEEYYKSIIAKENLD